MASANSVGLWRLSVLIRLFCILHWIVYSGASVQANSQFITLQKWNYLVFFMKNGIESVKKGFFEDKRGIGRESWQWRRNKIVQSHTNTHGRDIEHSTQWTPLNWAERWSVWVVCKNSHPRTWIMHIFISIFSNFILLCHLKMFGCVTANQFCINFAFSPSRIKSAEKTTTIFKRNFPLNLLSVVSLFFPRTIFPPIHSALLWYVHIFTRHWRAFRA